MTWQEYYDRFYDWSENTQISRISDIDSFKRADKSEIIDAAMSFVNETYATKIIKKAIEGGIRFTTDEVMELIYIVREDFYRTLTTHVSGKYTREQLEELEGMLSEDEILSLAELSGIKYYDDEFEEEKVNTSSVKSNGSGFWGNLLAFSLALGSLSSKPTHKHSGRCEGDCSKCPPHYGYRYGRWYYGRNHRYGCEFGENKNP